MNVPLSTRSGRVRHVSPNAYLQPIFGLAGYDMDRMAHFIMTTALTLVGIIILGPGGASMLAQYFAGLVPASWKPSRGA
jgi:hypothetical protein